VSQLTGIPALFNRRIFAFTPNHSPPGTLTDHARFFTD